MANLQVFECDVLFIQTRMNCDILYAQLSRYHHHHYY